MPPPLPAGALGVSGRVVLRGLRLWAEHHGLAGFLGRGLPAPNRSVRRGRRAGAVVAMVDRWRRRDRAGPRAVVPQLKDPREGGAHRDERVRGPGIVGTDDIQLLPDYVDRCARIAGLAADPGLLDERDAEVRQVRTACALRRAAVVASRDRPRAPRRARAAARVRRNLKGHGKCTFQRPIRLAYSVRISCIDCHQGDWNAGGSFREGPTTPFLGDGGLSASAGP